MSSSEPRAGKTHPTGTTSTTALADELLGAVDAFSADAIGLARWMSANPELSLEEHETSARYRAHLEELGFSIDPVSDDMPTAFVARSGDVRAPIRAALLAEMDALPEIGHACGHNLSGPASLLAARALRATLEPGDAQIVVVGCPAEETGIGKRKLVEAGVFDDVDVAMMAHASDMRRAHRLFLGNEKFEFVFRGRASHAAAYPEKGVNALDGVVSFFVSMGLLRQQLPSGVRVHGIISDGGEAPNIIPERAAARVWVRALDEGQLRDAARRMVDCARGAALATGTELDLREESGASPPMRPNLPLASSYRRQLDALGAVETRHAPGESIGSSDITHVSRVVPTIHPNFPINAPGESLQLHTREFTAATTTALGEAGLLEGARALALTVLELATDPGLRDAVKQSHAADVPAPG